MKEFKLIAPAIVMVIILIIGLIVAVPYYNVWRQGMRGQAMLRQAEYEKQIITIEAEAILEAERLNAEAEVVRSKGMAQAMEIESGMLSELYLHYLWIRTMAEHGDVIYVATEAGLPIIPRVNYGG